MNKFLEWLKQIPSKIVEWWNKYTAVQKVAMIGVTAAVFIAIIVASSIVSRPHYVTLITTETVKDMKDAKDALDDANIKYKLSEDDLTMTVDEKDYSNALMALADKDIPSIGMTLDELFNNSFQTTESEKKLKANIYKQDWLRQALCKMDNIDDAVVSITTPTVGNTLFEETKETSVSCILTVTDNFDKKNAKTIANLLAGAVGNPTTDSITVADQDGNLLFQGADEDILNQSITSIQEFVQSVSAAKKDEVYTLLVGGIPDYNDAKIAANFNFDMDKINEVYTEYTVAEGNKQGYKTHEYSYEAQNTNGAGGTPGTDANTATDTMITDNGANSGTVTINENDYSPNQRITTTDKAMGTLKAADSSIAINLISYVTYNEDEMKKNGQLNGQTFDEFMYANKDPQALTVSDDVKNLVAAATGLDTTNIQILAWQVPIFQPSAGNGLTMSQILMLVLAILIAALLIFVVFRGLAPVEVTEMEPELSVEQLLATTKENQSLDDIEFSDQSETRKMIDKFVDENPEAVAQLLRNWLNDDWGQ